MSTPPNYPPPPPGPGSPPPAADGFGGGQAFSPQPPAGAPGAPAQPGTWSPTHPAPGNYPGGQGDYPGGQAWTGFDESGQPTPPVQQRPWWKRAGVLIRLGILAVVVLSGIGGWLGSAKRDGSGAINNGGTLAATDLRVGDCYNEPEGDTFTDVAALPCTEPHDSEVFHVATLTAASFPTDDEVFAAAEANCLPAFEPYVGLAYEQSALEIGIVSPSQELWDDGDRSLVCTANNLDGTPLTATVKGSAR